MTNDDTHQQRANDCLAGVGYDITVVAETAALVAALKVRRPYAVVIDRKMGGQSAEQSPADYSDTLIQHKCHSHIPASIPQVFFADDGQGHLTFSLSKDGTISARASSRLGDAIRQSDENPLVKNSRPCWSLMTSRPFWNCSQKRCCKKASGCCAPSTAAKVWNSPRSICRRSSSWISTCRFSGTQIVEQLRAHPRTKNIPILINTGTVLNEEERQRLAGHVQSITSKTERENLLTELERLGALSDETVAAGVNL